MSKILQGKIVSNKMVGTAIVEVTRVVPHPLYKKLLTKSKKFKVDTKGQKVELGQVVKIIETRPVSAGKHFALLLVDKPVKSEVKPKVEAIAKQKVEAEVKPKTVRKSKKEKKA